MLLRFKRAYLKKYLKFLENGWGFHIDHNNKDK